MNKQTKILIGIGAAIALYLIFKPKKAVAKTDEAAANETPNPSPAPLPVVDPQDPVPTEPAAPVEQPKVATDVIKCDQVIAQYGDLFFKASGRGGGGMFRSDDSMMVAPTMAAINSVSFDSSSLTQQEALAKIKELGFNDCFQEYMSMPYALPS